MKVLGIETSCDETCVAIYDANLGIIANKSYNQNNIHVKYGGVVPELASREHLKQLIPLIYKTLSYANLSIKNINIVAYTAGPGLIGSLLVGATVGCSIAFSLKIPAIAVHHLEGHIITPILNKKYSVPESSYLVLLVSGGHTQIIEVLKFGRYRILGSTLDDSVGDAFDKTARLLNVKNPNGAYLSNLAKRGREGRFMFSRPMTNDKLNLNFSFSGIKTQVKKVLLNIEKNIQNYADIALAFENAIIETLVIKCKHAINITGYKNLSVVGGVSANKRLRLILKREMHAIGVNTSFPSKHLCTDNAAMIAYLGFLKSKNNVKNDFSIKVFPEWKINEISK